MSKKPSVKPAAETKNKTVAVTAIVDVLTPYTDKEQTQILEAVRVLLGMLPIVSTTGSARPSGPTKNDKPPTLDEFLGVPMSYGSRNVPMK